MSILDGSILIGDGGGGAVKGALQATATFPAGTFPRFTAQGWILENPNPVWVLYTATNFRGSHASDPDIQSGDTDAFYYRTDNQWRATVPVGGGLEWENTNHNTALGSNLARFQGQFTSESLASASLPTDAQSDGRSYHAFFDSKVQVVSRFETPLGIYSDLLTAASRQVVVDTPRARLVTPSIGLNTSQLGYWAEFLENDVVIGSYFFTIQHDGSAILLYGVENPEVVLTTFHGQVTTIDHNIFFLYRTLSETVVPVGSVYTLKIYIAEN